MPTCGRGGPPGESAKPTPPATGTPATPAGTWAGGLAASPSVVGDASVAGAPAPPAFGSGAACAAARSASVRTATAMNPLRTPLDNAASNKPNKLENAEK